MTEYPEHEKLMKIKDKSQTIGDFLEWLGSEKEIYLCSLVKYEGMKEQLQYIQKRKEDLLAEFFKIDLAKLEAEKQQMLETMRSKK
jgi:uncharacterized protein with NRDE domain